MVLSGNTALEFWLLLRQKYGNLTNQKGIRISTDSKELDVSDFSAFFSQNPCLTPRFEILTVKKRDPSAFFQYVRPQNLEGLTALKIADNLYVLSPVSTLVSLVWKNSSLIDAVLAASELGSAFARTGNTFTSSKSELERVTPLITESSLASWAKLKSTRRVQATLASVARHSVLRAYSPPEIALALMLSLPRNYGGCGFPKPILNCKLELRKRNGAFYKRVYPDLYWPKQKLILEYDGISYHSQDGNIIKDTGKRNLLRSLGYEVINATKNQLWNLREFALLEEALGLHIKVTGSTGKGLSRNENFTRNALRSRIMAYLINVKI
ncbi:MAG: hypothetical protein HUJ63_11815 [Enterococcus sp.]|nr:hypothetical protein [Enterococcus sp.]